jgi:signal transduction histidine kinase
MKKKLAAGIVTIALLAATYGLLFVYDSMHRESSPKAVDGRLDLTGWNFERDGIVPLDGEWEFYPDRLLAPEDFASQAGSSAEPSPTRIHVPGSWSDRMNTQGVATYRLKIRISDAKRVYGLKTSSIQIANRIYVNGEIIGASGNPAQRDRYTAMNLPYVGYFPLRPGWNEIVVQAANFDFKAGSGINESILFGYAGQISSLRDVAVARDWISFSVFIIIGLFLIGFFSQRTKNVSLLVFGLVCVFIALYSSTRGERVLFSLFGPVPFRLYLCVQMSSAVCAGAGFLLYAYAAFRPFCSAWAVRLGLIAGGILTAWSFAPLQLSSTEPFRWLVTLYSTLPLLYMTYVFVLAALHKAEGSASLAIAAVAVNGYDAVQNMNVYCAVPIYKAEPFGPFLFLLVLALLLSLRFSGAFRKIEEMSVQLLNADKLKDDFLARTSHEFKTPLHGMFHISKAMLDDPVHPLTAEQQERLRLITDIAERLLQLVNDILDFSKLKQGELSIDPKPVDVRSAVEVQARIYSYLSAGRNVRIDNRVPERLPLALVDEIRFGRIVGNLLDNAIKHTRDGSVAVTAREANGWIEISVRDTGEGIEARDMPHLFEPFIAFDSKMTRQGFGLGLSIVKQLVELHRGKISVASVKGAGTTFTFTLPAAGSAGASGAKASGGRSRIKEPAYAFPTPYYSKRKGRRTVLVADDQFANLKLLIDALESMDCDIIAVKNGYEAIEQLDRVSGIELVILDLMMPGLSGYEVCQIIRKKYTMLELPVLMVTAAIQPQDKVASFQAGANDFLPKPFDLAELNARIENLITLKELFGKAVDLEVAFLQSQIKPHFLFNILNSIVATSYTDIEKSRKLTMDLADYLRGSFRFSNLDARISFREEFRLIQVYIELEQARFSDRIRFEYDIPENIYDISIPPLLFQPLIENAVHHGVGTRLRGGTIRMAAREEPGQYCFVIEDDGIGIEAEQLARLLDDGARDRSGVGLLNINKRLKYKYGTELKLDSEPGKGTRVTVRIPNGAYMGLGLTASGHSKTEGSA